MKEADWLVYSYSEINKWSNAYVNFPTYKTFQNKLTGVFPSLDFVVYEGGFKCTLPFELNLYDNTTTKFQKTIKVFGLLPNGILKDLLTKEPTVEIHPDRLVFKDLILTVHLEIYLGGKERHRIYLLEHHTFKTKETKNFTIETAKCRK